MEIIIMQINQSYNNFDTQKTIQILKKRFESTKKSNSSSSKISGI